MKFQRPWVVVAYGDIRGFGAWTASPSTSPEIKDPFVVAFHATLARYVKQRDKRIHVQFEGDGFMLIRELTPAERKNGAYAQFVRSVQTITRDVLRDLAGVEGDGLAGFRVRFTDGYSYKFMMPDPNDPTCQREVPVYMEYALNAASHLKNVNPGVLCLVFKSFAKALGKYRDEFGVRPLGKPSCYPPSVDRQHVKTLHVLEKF